MQEDKMTDEGFDADVDASADAADSADVSASSDLAANEGMDIEIEPLTDIPATEMATMGEMEAPISEQELSELQNEAEALEIQPLDEGVDLGYDYEDAIQEANETIEVQPYEPSSLENIINAGASGAASPSAWAQVGGDVLAPPGAGEAVAQGLQMGANVALAGSKEFMEAAINQHGKSPSVEYNEMLISQAIDEKPHD
jgi:hypothetical protein